jgi:hypothetical protein
MVFEKEVVVMLGLALEGGGAKGAFHMGAIKAYYYACKYLFGYGKMQHPPILTPVLR